MTATLAWARKRSHGCRSVRPSLSRFRGWRIECAFPFVQGELRRYVDENRLTASEKQELQVECRACRECAVFRSEKPFLCVILIPPLSPSGLPRRQPQHGER